MFNINVMLSGKTKLITNYGIIEAEKIYEILKENDVYLLTKNLKWKKIVCAEKKKEKIIKVHTERGIIEVSKDQKILTKIGNSYVKIPIQKAYENFYKLLSIKRIPERIISIKSKKIAYLIAKIISGKYVNYNFDSMLLIPKFLNNLESFVLSLDYSSIKTFIKNITEINEFTKNAIILAYLKLGYLVKFENEKIKKEKLKDQYEIYLIEEGEEDYLYNFEIFSKNDKEKNFVALTNEYLPIVLSY